MKRIYERKKIDGKEFILTEKIGDYTEALVAAQEYRLEGLYARIQPSYEEGLYLVWTRPGRIHKPRMLKDEIFQGNKLRFLKAI